MSAPRILVVGGTGAFGERLVHGLTSTTKFDVLMGTRTPGRDRVQIDTQTVTAQQLCDLGLFAVADAAGPYQSGNYRLARAAIAARIHYVDIADARNFVAGFPALDAEARAAGVTALTGASSTPALSNAVLDELVRGWSAIDSIEIAIAPGNRAPRGLSVIQSILSYSGKPVRVFLDGGWTERPGWGLTLHSEIEGLGKRYLSLCETPDLDLVPTRFSPRRSALFRAGLELPVMHLGLAAGAKLVQWGLLPSLFPFAKPLRWIAERLEPFGGDRGGMIVEASGLDEEGKPCRASWTLVAEAGDGPVIPTLPALAVLRALADGRLQTRGAMVCAGVLGLETLVAEFAPYRINLAPPEPAMTAPLYARLLGNRWDILPAELRMVHSPAPRLDLAGQVKVDGAANAPACLVRWILGFPEPGEERPIAVLIETTARGERWTWRAGGRQFSSELSLARKRGFLRERFGPLTFAMTLPSDQDGLEMFFAGWRLGPLPLPAFLAPRFWAREFVDDRGRFNFDVTLALPLIGRIVAYRGWLELAVTKASK